MRTGSRFWLLAGWIAAVPAGAEIRYIPLEEAESTRQCLLFTNRLNEAEDELRQATVAGGSALGKTTVETNAIRTKLKFERDYYRRKSAEACAEEEAEAQREAEAQQEAEAGEEASTAPEPRPATASAAVAVPAADADADPAD